MITLIFFLSIHQLHAVFSPNRSDFNAYGVKLAMNEIFLVLAENGKNPPGFFLHFSPYNISRLSSQCSIPFPDPIHHFVYTVTIGKQQRTDQTHFYFAGELINNRSGLFIGIAVLNYTQIVMNFNSTNPNMTLPCNTSFSYQIQYLYNYSHQEYFILGVEPRGRWVYGFTNEFILTFDSRNTSRLDIWNASSIWPNPTFIPNAVDLTHNFGVVSGYIYNGKNATNVYRSTIYLMNFNQTINRPFIVNEYRPIATPGTWQDLLPSEDAYLYSAKYDMAVSINENGNTIVGMQYINRVFLFSVNISQPKSLVFVSRHTNGRQLGNGKSIAWLQNGIAGLIVNVYTLDYQWEASQVHVYAMENAIYNSNSTPLSVFPNNHLKLPASLNAIFISIASGPSSLALLDSHGGLLIFTPTAPGFYLTIEDTGFRPLITSTRVCMPGTYKNVSGVHDCTLCPPGTRNPGNFSTECISCSPRYFCPLASVNEVPDTALNSINQAIPYPKSPDSVIFDEILIQNMFSVGTGHCIALSPLFWTLIAASFGFVIITIMGILKYCIKTPRSRKIRSSLKCIFRHADLIGEGELWVGGLASFSVVVLVAFACIFSQRYIRLYPIETSPNATFACDETIRNAKFQTSVQSLAIPLNNFDQKMFDLLDNQEFLLNVDFVNTLINCDAVSIEALYGITWTTIRWLSCDNINSTLKLAIPLPFQHISVQIYVADSKTIGGLRIGLYSPGHQTGSYSLKELNFIQAFYKIGQILARDLPVTVSLTKVVNETLALDGGDSDFGGIYIPTFTVDYNSLFYTADQFVRSTLTVTTLSLILSETPYYVKNLQQPIAKPSEIVFQNLLFITVCLELFGLIFLMYKMLFKPFYYYLIKKKHRKRGEESYKTKTYESDLGHLDKSAPVQMESDTNHNEHF